MKSLAKVYMITIPLILQNFAKLYIIAILLEYKEFSKSVHDHNPFNIKELG